MIRLGELCIIPFVEKQEMGKFIDLTKQKFGRLTVIERKENNKRKNAQWLCQCNCGNYSIVVARDLRNSNTKSCGCFQKDQTRSASYIHGYGSVKIKNRTYKTWAQMHHRCNNPNSQNYKNYGGRGIKVCKKWWKFEGFLQDMGERPLNMSIDRIDNDGHYCKKNCQWSTAKGQARNRKTNRLFTIDGITKCLAEWCEIYQKSYHKVWYRIHRGWTPEEALELVPRKKKK